MTSYKCDDCGGELIYHEQDLEHGEHHECQDCGKIYPYEPGPLKDNIDSFNEIKDDAVNYPPPVGFAAEVGASLLTRRKPGH